VQQTLKWTVQRAKKKTTVTDRLSE
jgi:hypothetical protein